MDNENIVSWLRRRITPEEYENIRHEWITHSKAEDARDIPGLMSTLTEDCVYIYPQTGERWDGHEGATKFYTDLLTAVPDIHFDLQTIVIGPQGVYEEARATGTPVTEWQGNPPTGEPFDLTISIYFPWDPEKKKFQGERMFIMGKTGKMPL
ncbi:MAG: nuclear transport factor 2 family protein [Planctomycetales bacterium]|nr:nuclear transport factor 2 family protein [Planctomycetales bacterium]